MESHQPALVDQTRASTARPRAGGSRGRIRTCIRPVLSRLPLPLGHAAVSLKCVRLRTTGSSGWSRTNVSGFSGRRLGAASATEESWRKRQDSNLRLPEESRVSNPVRSAAPPRFRELKGRRAPRPGKAMGMGSTTPPAWWWTRRDSNPRSPACGAGAFPLGYTPVGWFTRQASNLHPRVQSPVRSRLRHS